MNHPLAALVLSTSLLSAQGPAPLPAQPPKPVGQEPAQDPTRPDPVQPATPGPEGTKPVAQPTDGKPTNGKRAAGKTTDGKTADGKPAVGTQGGGDQGKPAQPADTPAPTQPTPRGADPADLAAIRSAEAMIAAERKLSEMIKGGKITGLDQVLTFDELSAWPYEDGLKGMPKRVRDVDGKKVLMSGFMLPIDEVQNIKEFLLVQSLWSCCYGQPPDINGIVRVVMPGDKRTDYFFDPLKIIGKFKVEATVIDGYCVDIYQIEAESIEPLK